LLGLGDVLGGELDVLARVAQLALGGAEPGAQPRLVGGPAAGATGPDAVQEPAQQTGSSLIGGASWPRASSAG
jgi:hypothetical protein